MDMQHVSFISVILATFIGPNIGQGEPCDPFTCAENAECVDGQCYCKTGYIGYGRFICVTPDQCPCGSYGDPHILQFDRGRSHSVLPCQFNLASFTTSIGCHVQVEMVTYHRPNQTHPLRAFTMMLKVKVTRDNTVLEFTLGFAGISPYKPVTTTNSSLPDTILETDITVVRSTFDKYIRATLPECDNTSITFDPSILASAVVTPRTGTFSNPSFCGNCNGDPLDDNPFLTLPNVTPEEANLALSLRQLSNDQSTADAEYCMALRLNSSTPRCSDDATLIKAVRCCGVLYDSDFARCLVTDGNIVPEELLRIVKECIYWYCVENRRDVAAVFVPVMATFGCDAPKDYVCR